MKENNRKAVDARLPAAPPKDKQMRIPGKTKIGSWAQDIVDECSVSLTSRIERGIAFRNLYLTGDMDSDAQIYNKCFSHIETLSSQLYSPVELRYNIDYYGYTAPVYKAMAETAAGELNRQFRHADVDIEAGSAVTWSLVKGKCFIKLLWGDDGFEPYLIQPEMMGVYREDITRLDRQEAFFQSTYYTPEAFYHFLELNPEREAIYKKVARYHASKENSASRDTQNTFKRIILSGLYPVSSQDAKSPNAGGRNIVQWMNSPVPSFSPNVMASLIRLDELWVRDDERQDWTTIQCVGNNVVEGKETRRNLFADAYDPDNTMKKLKPDDSGGNPLSGHHPYIEFCANPLDGYFWGRPELCNVGLVQEALNSRVNGIASLLRRQEDPNYLFTGISSSAKDIMAKIKKPGGHLVDSNPNAKGVPLSPELPKGLFETINEYISWFDDMSGFTPTLSGKGESGVRAGAHAETLVRMASPRIKDGAIMIERQLESLGGLALDILRAKVARQLTAWMMPKETMMSKIASLFAKFSEEEFEEGPPGMKPIKFLMYQLPDDCKVVVDSHSGSPAFIEDGKQLLFALAKMGAVTPEYVVKHTHPPSVEDALQTLREKEIAQQDFAEKHPEIAAAEAEKQTKKKK